MSGTACPFISDALPCSTECPAPAEGWVACSSPASEKGLDCLLGATGFWG